MILDVIDIISTTYKRMKNVKSNKNFSTKVINIIGLTSTTNKYISKLPLRDWLHIICKPYVLFLYVQMLTC